MSLLCLQRQQKVMSNVTPVYEEMPGWTESTVGATSVDALTSKC